MPNCFSKWLYQCMLLPEVYEYIGHLTFCLYIHFWTAQHLVSFLWFCELESQMFALPDLQSLGISTWSNHANWLLPPGTLALEWERHRSQGGLQFISGIMAMALAPRGRGGSDINSGFRCILDPSHDKILAVILGFRESPGPPVSWTLFSSLFIPTVDPVSSPVDVQWLPILLLNRMQCALFRLPITAHWRAMRATLWVSHLKNEII